MKNLLLLISTFLISTSLFADSSASREEKKFTVVAAPLGFEFDTTSASLEGGVFLDSKSTLTAQLTQLQQAGSSVTSGDEDDSTDEAQDLWDEAGKGFAFSINYKKFVSNTFYIRPSLYYRSQKIVISTTEILGALTDKEAGSVHDAGVSFRIGNQWQWDRFTLGCDWVGISQTLAVFERSGNLKDDSFKSALSLVNFYLGVSF